MRTPARKEGSEGKAPSFGEFFHATKFLQQTQRQHRFVPPIVFHVGKFEAPPAPPSISEVFAMLARQIDEQIVQPILGAATREAVEEEVSNRIAIFGEQLQTLRGLLMVNQTQDQVRTLANQSAETAVDALCGAAARFGGAPAADDAHFAATTYASAIRVARSVQEAAKRPDHMAELRPLDQEFQSAALFHELGALLVFSLGAGRTGTLAASQFAFAALRFGALDAYTAARQAQILLRGDEQVGDLLPFDAEDEALSRAE